MNGVSELLAEFPHVSEEAIRSQLLSFALSRGVHKTYCPSEVARSLFPNSLGCARGRERWRGLMEPIRIIAQSMQQQGILTCSQRGKHIADIAQVRGPIRLAIHANYQHKQTKQKQKQLFQTQVTNQQEKEEKEEKEGKEEKEEKEGKEEKKDHDRALAESARDSPSRKRKRNEPAHQTSQSKIYVNQLTKQTIITSSPPPSSSSIPDNASASPGPRISTNTANTQPSGKEEVIDLTES